MTKRRSGEATSQEKSQRIHLALGVPLALLSGCLVFLSFPTFNLFPLQWFSLVPLVIAARKRSFRGGFFLGFLAGLSTNLGGFYWISHVLREFGHMTPQFSWTLTVLVVSYQALVFAFATGFTAHIATRFGKDFLWFLTFPAIFTACEYIVPFIFPWYFANGQSLFYAVTQFIEFTGVSGLSFLLVLVNVAIADVISSRLAKSPFPWPQVVVSALLFLVAVGYGVKRIDEIDNLVAQAPKVKVAIVEPDVGIWEKEAKRPDGKPLPPAEQIRVLYRNLLKHHILSAYAERNHKPNLIVWPESSYLPTRQVLHRATNKEIVIATQDGRIGFVGLRGEFVWDQGADAVTRLSGVQAICALDEKNIFAVGHKGVAYFFDGQTWVREATQTDRDLYAVACGTEAVVAVGLQGVVAVRRGGKWALLESGVTENLYAITEAEGTFVAAGEKGIVLSIKNNKVTRLTDVVGDLFAVSYSKTSGLWVGGTEGLWHGNLRQLSRRDFPGGSVKAIAAGSITWVLDAVGSVFRCDKSGCNKVNLGTKETAVAIAGDGRHLSWSLGNRGTIYKIGPEDAPREWHTQVKNIAAAAMAFIPFSEGYPLPKGVTALYTSPLRLPDENILNLEQILRADSAPEQDKNAAMRGFATPLLFGTVTMEEHSNQPEQRNYYNTALLLSPEGLVLGTYDKNYLLIFGEYLPFSDLFPFLEDWFPEAGNFKPGKSVEVFELDGTRIGVMICYEDIIPEFIRRIHEKRPHFLVNITNDAWFGKTTEPYQHLALATFRTIESRKFLVRATNTGVSAIVDPVGRILKKTSLDEPEVIVAEVAKLDAVTLYQQYGDIFSWACCGVSALLVCISFLRKKALPKQQRR